MSQLGLASYPGTWELSHVRLQYGALMELLEADVFASDDELLLLVNDRAAVLGEELDKRLARRTAIARHAKRS